MAKVTTIELEIPQGKVAFPAEQADGILRMKFNGGWHLPEDSEWTWSAEKDFEKKVKAQPKGRAAEQPGDGGASTAAPDKAEDKD